MKLTKEEIIEKISNDDVLPYIEPWALKEIVEFVIQNSKPTFPSGLDEAAIDAAQLDMQDRQIMEATDDERLRYSRIFRRGFIAGAEWMAGPGVNLKCWIARDECSGDESNLYIGQQKPRRIPGTAPGFGMWCDYGEFMALPSDMFPELTYSDEPIEVELLIKKI